MYIVCINHLSMDHVPPFSMKVSNNGWWFFLLPKMDDLRVPLFQETSIALFNNWMLSRWPVSHSFRRFHLLENRGWKVAVPSPCNFWSSAGVWKMVGNCLLVRFTQGCWMACWMGCWDYHENKCEMDHSLIPYVKRTSKIVWKKHPGDWMTDI